MDDSVQGALKRHQGKVKWYNDQKGFGFIDLDGGEVFIHRSALASFGAVRIQSEDLVTVTIRESDRGLVVAQLCGIERPPVPEGLMATEAEEGEEFAEVKFFNEEKGYGFLLVENYDEDVFIHTSVLERAGVPGLESGQSVLVRVQPDDNGCQATSIRLYAGVRADMPQPSL